MPSSSCSRFKSTGTVGNQQPSQIERRHPVSIGGIFIFDEAGSDIKPKGKHVHLQMKKGQTGHWYLPVGRFGEAMSKLHDNGHLAATTSPAPAESSSCGNGGGQGGSGGTASAPALGTSRVSKAAETTTAAAPTAE